MTSGMRSSSHYEQVQRLLEEADRWTSAAHRWRAMSGTEAERASFKREAAKCDALARQYNDRYLQAQRRP